LQGEADPNELLDAVEEWTPLQRYLKDAALVEYWLRQPASQDIDELRSQVRRALWLEKRYLKPPP